MSKTTKRTLILFCLIVCFFSILLINPFVVNGNEKSISEVKEEYRLNDSLIIPDYYIEKDGQNILATSYSLEYPDGNLRQGKNHVLDIAGEYVIHYLAYKDDNMVCAEKKFTVTKDLFSYKNSKSSVSYGKNSSYLNSPDGLVLSVAPKDCISFNKIINLSDMTKNDKLLSFYVTPLEVGNFDASYITIRLTDVYDEDNYVDVTYRCLLGVRSWAAPLTYIVAQTNGNQTVGGTDIGNMWGYPTYQTFCGVGLNGLEVGDDPYNLYFDNENRQVWVNHVSADADLTNKPVADLDDPLIFTNPWKGFTTGEVYLSVFADSYRSPTANIVVTYLKGYNLREEIFKDNISPLITVDFNNNTEVPNGIVNVPYRIFDAKAIDDYQGSVDVMPNVYYKYNTLGQQNVKVIDGCFYPQYQGVYTIEYSAKDYFNNVSIKTVEIEIGPDVNGLYFDIIGANISGKSGEIIKAFSDIDFRNARGKTSILAKAVLDNEEIILDENYSFKPLKAGLYTIKVCISDYIETIEKTFIINVSANEAPVFDGEISLDKYFINGQKYKLPTYPALDLSGVSPKKIDSKIYVKEDNGEEKAVSNNEYIVNAKNTVEVIYKASVNNKITTKSYVIEVINAIKEVEGDSLFDVAKLFKVVNGSGIVDCDSDYVNISSTQDCRVIFANAVQVSDFVTKFKFDQINNNFEGLNIYLTDKENEQNSIKLTYTYDQQLTFVAVNDGESVQVPLNTSTSDRTQMMLGYLNDSRQVYGHKSLLMNVEKTVYGEIFSGFNCNLAYVEFELFGVKGNSVVHISKLNNQSLYYFESEDFISPEIFTKRSNGDVDLNEYVTIFGVKAYDVLTNSVLVTMEVKGPDGKFVIAEDGTTLDSSCDYSKDYVVKTTQYGTYIITITAKDYYGNRNRISYGFSVIDKTPPTITVNENTQKVKVGQEVAIKDYSVSDNISLEENIKVQVYVFYPNSVMKAVNDGKFTVETKGTYIVYYYCYDELNNITIVSYYINAE